MKGTYSIIYQLALLKSENQILRQENQNLSKQHRAKNTHLRRGGSLTISEGQAIQAPTEVDEQVNRETSQRGGRTSSADTRQQRCGACGKPGHNARTYQTDMPLSEESDADYFNRTESSWSTYRGIKADILVGWITRLGGSLTCGLR